MEIWYCINHWNLPSTTSCWFKWSKALCKQCFEDIINSFFFFFKSLNNLELNVIWTKSLNVLNWWKKLYFETLMFTPRFEKTCFPSILSFLGFFSFFSSFRQLELNKRNAKLKRCSTKHDSRIWSLLNFLTVLFVLLMEIENFQFEWIPWKKVPNYLEEVQFNHFKEGPWYKIFVVDAQQKTEWQQKASEANSTLQGHEKKLDELNNKLEEISKAQRAIKSEIVNLLVFSNSTLHWIAYFPFLGCLTR